MTTIPSLASTSAIADRSDRVCVIGAGPCGLTACKNLSDAGIPFDCLEQQDDVGGNWYYGSPHSSIFQCTQLISSKRLTEFFGFPMPYDYPQYPHHGQLLDYLRKYAAHYGLRDHIQFNTKVTRLEAVGDQLQLSTEHGGVARYAAVVIANGHHTDPRWPDIPGTFTGQLLHSRDYKTPDVVRGARVLVIGGGNSGCDIAVEASYHAASVTLSLRRGYHFLPKFLFGAPLDRCGATIDGWWLPRWIKRRITRFLIQVAVGPSERYGLPRPDHPLFASHPLVNSQVPHLVAHRRIAVRPDVKSWEGATVCFVDGSRQDFDVVICGTGFYLSFPFVRDHSLLNCIDGVPELFLNAFHPTRDDIFVAGMIQPIGGIWRLADLQMQLVARYLLALRRAPGVAAWFRRRKSRGATTSTGRQRYISTPRHHIEVDYFELRHELERWLAGWERRMPFATAVPLAK